MKTVQSRVLLLAYFIFLIGGSKAQTVTQLVNFGQGQNSKGKVDMAFLGSKVYILFTSAASNMGRICRYDLNTQFSTISGDLFPTIAATDASHNDAAIAVDGSGFIHVWIGMHNSKMKYWRSNSPDDITSFTDYSAQMPGYNDTGVDEKQYTYPSATTATNGDVFVILRRTALFLSGGVVKGALTNEKQDLYHWNNQTKTWSVDLALKQDSKNAYMSNIFGDRNNNIHIVTAWSQRHYGDNTFQRGTYLKYNNTTNIYSKANGTVLTTPVGVDINPADVFYPGEKTWNDTISEIQTPTVVLNGAGNPIISLPYNINFSQNYPQYVLDVVSFNQGVWNRQKNIFQGVKNYERPPLTAFSNSVNIYTRNTSAYILKSVDNGISFPTQKNLSSGSQPVDAVAYNSTIDLYITPSTLYKIVFPTARSVFQEVNQENDLTAIKVKLDKLHNNLFILNEKLLKNRMATCSIIDLSGRQLLNSTISNNGINVSTLKSGIYILEIKDNEAKYTIKFLK